MQPVVEAARAKINLALHVLGRRADGYHELDSIVAFADLGDRLTVAPASANALLVEGPFAADVPADEGNIIWKAWAHVRGLLDVPFVSVILEKNLPVASGIGGGSADAAALVRALLRLAGARLSEAQVAGLAAIGADVPVCFVGKPCRMEGIGEKISVLSEQLPPALVLVNPLAPCGTAEVFKAMGLKPGEVLATRADLRNDMTAAAVQVQPRIADVLSALEKTALWPVRMSGSGASCFGIANSLEEAEAVAAKLSAAHPAWWVKAARLG
ncbi:MAG: 4-(cytidine 5'-diphospho)-2-C-methyl-D-erythritol kinase [Alphaproteobacteria bacterium]|nr:4-(cytidine 5'-diphospho)-2-C-methyl-D-erythritol kinase [Alphaproteobacteria bacterium]